MTFEEFDSTLWDCGMFGRYKGSIFPISRVDFDERLIGLAELTGGTDEPTMVRCENVTLVSGEEK